MTNVIAKVERICIALILALFTELRFLDNDR